MVWSQFQFVETNIGNDHNVLPAPDFFEFAVEAAAEHGR
jgi:hypothetical protein